MQKLGLTVALVAVLTLGVNGQRGGGGGGGGRGGGGGDDSVDEPGCCYGTDAKCQTDSKSTCDKMAARKGCEWRSGADADCTIVVEPGCCFSATGDSKCAVDDQATCEKNARRGGCEWRTGDDPDLCAIPPPEPGCCYSATMDSRCDTDDQATCEKNARRGGCEWRVGDEPDLCLATTTTPEPGCCGMGNEDNKNAENCLSINDEKSCEKKARQWECEWVTGQVSCVPELPFKPGCTDAGGYIMRGWVDDADSTSGTDLNGEYLPNGPVDGYQSYKKADDDLYIFYDATFGNWHVDISTAGVEEIRAYCAGNDLNACTLGRWNVVDSNGNWVADNNAWVVMCRGTTTTTKAPTNPPTTAPPTTTTWGGPVTTDDGCFPQGPCSDGWMDQTEGNYFHWNCGADCVGGAYFVDESCSCACIEAGDCSDSPPVPAHLRFDDEYGAYGESLHAGSIECFGSESCSNREGTSMEVRAENDLECMGYRSCDGSDLVAGGEITCGGERSCSGYPALCEEGAPANSISAAEFLYCAGYQSCAWSESISAMKVVCNGEESCKDAMGAIVAQDAINCNGERGCKNSELTAVDVTCSGRESCAMTRITSSDDDHFNGVDFSVDCQGVESCSGAVIRGVTDIAASGYMAVAGADMNSLGMDRMKVSLSGEQAGSNAWLTCQPGSVCTIICEGDACADLTVYCATGSGCFFGTDEVCTGNRGSVSCSHTEIDCGASGEVVDGVTCPLLVVNEAKKPELRQLDIVSPCRDLSEEASVGPQRRQLLSWETTPTQPLCCACMEIDKWEGCPADYECEDLICARTDENLNFCCDSMWQWDNLMGCTQAARAICEENGGFVPTTPAPTPWNCGTKGECDSEWFIELDYLPCTGTSSCVYGGYNEVKEALCGGVEACAYSDVYDSGMRCAAQWACNYIDWGYSSNPDEVSHYECTGHTGCWAMWEYDFSRGQTDGSLAGQTWACRGYQACQEAQIVNVNECSGQRGCERARIYNTDGDVHCGGQEACMDSYFYDSDALFCDAPYSCLRSQLYSQSSVDCGGSRSCEYAHIYGGDVFARGELALESATLYSADHSGNAMERMSVYATGKNAMSGAKLDCATGSTCTLYCFGSACDNMAGFHCNDGATCDCVGAGCSSVPMTVPTFDAKFVGMCDDRGTYSVSHDGGNTFEEMAATDNWVDATTLVVQATSDTVIRVVCKDMGVVGGFIASVEMEAGPLEGKVYATTNPIESGNFELVDGAHNHATLVYTDPKTPPPDGWGCCTEEIDDSAIWVWDDGRNSELTFEFNFANIWDDEPPTTTMGCFPQGPCDDGYMDKTDGNYNKWACGSGCVGGQYWTDDGCGCACVPAGDCADSSQQAHHRRPRGKSESEQLAFEEVAVGAAPRTLVDEPLVLMVAAGVVMMVLGAVFYLFGAKADKEEAYEEL